jgi:hypothetical protein
VKPTTIATANTGLSLSIAHIQSWQSMEIFSTQKYLNTHSNEPL